MKEEVLYLAVKEKLEELFIAKNCEIYLEVTAKGFSNKLKNQIPENRHIIFSFLTYKPDLTGFIEEKYSKHFIVAEIKNRKIKLNDIYQLRKYSDLFQAKFAFLISVQEIPAEIKALCKVEYKILMRNYPLPNLTLVYFNKDINKFIEWFEENPFEKDIYWR